MSPLLTAALLALSAGVFDVVPIPLGTPEAPRDSFSTRPRTALST